jgi:large subunit ribosomal protein L24
MSKKKHIKKGDMVKVLSGADRGKEGRVLSVLIEKDRAIVEGVNMVSRHTKPNAKDPKGGILHKEAAVHISNLMLIDPKSGDPTRVGRKRNDDGKLVRIAKKTGEEIN